MWRLLEYRMHSRSHSIYRLDIQIPDQHQILFRDGKERQALDRDRTTTLIQWFKLNTDTHNEDVKNLLYTEIK